MVWCGVGALGGSGISREGLPKNISRIILDRNILMGTLLGNLSYTKGNLMPKSQKGLLMLEYLLDALIGLVAFATFVGVAFVCDYVAVYVKSVGPLVIIVGWVFAICGAFTAICFEFHLTYTFIYNLWKTLPNGDDDQEGGDK